MKSECRDRVRRGKLPSWKNRLHDLEGVPDPIDASQQCCLVHARSRRQRELEGDFRLYAWLSESGEQKGVPYLGVFVSRGFKKIPPVGCVFFFSAPMGGIREPIFAPPRLL